MFTRKLIRYIEFSIPFKAYDAGDLNRTDLKMILQELLELQKVQHDELLETLDADEYLQEKHFEIAEKMLQVTKLFDGAIDVALTAFEQDPENEAHLFTEAKSMFKKGNEILADAYFAVDEIWESTGAGGFL